MNKLDEVRRFIEDTEPLKEEFVNWLESEEERLQRDLSDEEIDNKRNELFEKYNIKRI